MRFRKPEVLLCDLDGTLVDSVPDLAWSLNAMLQELHYPTVAEAAVRNWVGNGVEALIHRALTGEMHGQATTALFNPAKSLFMTFYQQSCYLRSRLFEGVQSGLTWLKQSHISLACVTNKDQQFTQPLLKQLEIEKYFDIVVSGDTLPNKKPHPAPLLHCAAHFDVTPEQAMMIGDSVNDVLASRAAGIPIICTSYGYNHGESIHHAKPDAVIDNFIELKSLFR